MDRSLLVVLFFLNSSMAIADTCTPPDASEHVCNGNFEMGPVSGASVSVIQWNGAFSNGPNPSQVPYWDSINSCDLVFKNRPGQTHHCTNLSYVFPANAISSQINLDMPNFTGNYAGFCRTNGTNYIERLTSKLKVPLTVGTEYTLTFDVHFQIADSNATNLTSIPATRKVFAALSTVCMLDDGSCGVPPPLTSMTNIVEQSIPVDDAIAVNGSSIKNGVWTRITKNFTATQPFYYIVLNIEGGYHIYSYFDNISIKKANAIKGKVYHDQNASGSLTLTPSAEPGVPGVQLALYQNSTVSSTAVPIYTVTSDANGDYVFPPPGQVLANTSNYYVVIKPENSVSSMTEPVLNSLMSNFQHSRKIPYSSGGVVENQNFGIIPTSPISLTSKIKVTCLKLGMVNLTVSGGVSPFTYSWTGPNGFTSSTEDLSGLVPGNYQVVVTGANGATATHTVTIPSPVPTTVSGVIAGNSIDITASGLAPYSYSWTGPNQFSSAQQDLSNVPPGTYTVVVTGANGCSSTQTFVVTGPILSGACCAPLPNANPLADCSAPIMNLGHPMGIYYGYLRCVQINQGSSCGWSPTNPNCCVPGLPGCGSVAGTLCSPPSVSIPSPFTLLSSSSDPAWQELAEQCKKQSANSANPESYSCCVTLTKQPTSSTSSVKSLFIKEKLEIPGKIEKK